MATTSQALTIALEHYKAGRIELADAVCDRIVAAEPDHAEALHIKGLVAVQREQYQQAVDLIGLAIAADPREATYHVNLGVALQSLGRSEDAINSCRKAVELAPGFADAHNSLGAALAGSGKIQEAIACFQQVVRLVPDYAQGHNNLGNALQEAGRLAEALPCYHRALELMPNLPGVHVNLGQALYTMGRLAEAVAAYQQGLSLQPDATTYNKLAIALQDQGRLDEAANCCARALQLDPLCAAAYSTYGAICKDRGELSEAISQFARSLQLRPEDVQVRSNLIYTLLFHPDYDARAVHEAHRQWHQLHVAPLASSVAQHNGDRSPERKLRVGYVSPDFRTHPVGRFLLPLLESHNRQAMEVFCYSSVQRQDSVTERFRDCSDTWRDVFLLSDAQLAQVIREDRIDILVDLTLHMAGSRLLVFARRPAPVQVTYLGYCGTTGLDAIDYRLTDPYLDPVGHPDERFYSERSVRLPETYWCYQPPAAAPPVNASPARDAASATFACLNNFCKVSVPTLVAWCSLLKAVPRSTLLIHAHEGRHRDRVKMFFAERGVSAERINFVGFFPSANYFLAYHQLDIGLDPFPYGGGTTTCDALWMGVPVVTLAGRTAVGRGGVSILSNIGLPELIARDTDDYVRIAAELAGDMPRLAGLRATLRQRMQDSPLMDAPRFARNVEAAYRQMWHRGCSGSAESQARETG
jgi:predicted O-linked N-acetylglucosamine transferase (SPINDLY family)